MTLETLDTSLKRVLVCRLHSFTVRSATFTYVFVENGRIDLGSFGPYDPTVGSNVTRVNRFTFSDRSLYRPSSGSGPIYPNLDGESESLGNL